VKARFATGKLTDRYGARRRVPPGRALAAAALFATVLSLGAEAADVAVADLQAAMRSLGFLSVLQNRASISVGIVYQGGRPESKAQAGRTAALLAKLKGPGGSTISATPVAAQDLSQGIFRFDAVYLLSLPRESGQIVSEFVKRQNVVSISNDTACLDAQSCVLLVQANPDMTIVLDTSLAREADANFSTVFTMLVKRR
jgi:hypothetical protein